MFEATVFNICKRSEHVVHGMTMPMTRDVDTMITKPTCSCPEANSAAFSESIVSATSANVGSSESADLIVSLNRDR